MSSTQAGYPRSSLVDSIPSLLSSGSSATSSRTSDTQQGIFPIKSTSFTMRPPTSPAPKNAHTALQSRTLQQRNTRPLSEIIRPESFMSPETQALDKWFEDLQEYEQNLESMASASLDTHFKDELNHVDQWFSYLNEAERTATVYSLLQHSSQVQIRFFITVLQQMGKKDSVGSLLSSTHLETHDLMQPPVSDMMTKAELGAAQKLISVLPYRTGQQQKQTQSHRGAAGNIGSSSGNSSNSNNISRHSYAFGEAEEQRLLRSLGPDFLPARGGAASLMDDAFMPQSRLSPQGSIGARPRSVIEGGDLSSIFSNRGGGWSFKQTDRILAGNGVPGRPKSADVSNWSFGLSSIGHAPATAGGSSGWNGLSPTTSTFTENPKTIARPNSASDIDHAAIMHWPPRMTEDTARFPRRRRGNNNNNSDNNGNSNIPTTIPGTVLETDEHQQVAGIVLSMFGGDDPAHGAGPAPKKTTSTHSAATVGLRDEPSPQTNSPVPTSSNSASLSPCWETAQGSHHPPAPSGSFGRFLNPNDRTQDDYGYISDHSESSNVSGRNNRSRSSNSNANSKVYGQRGTSAGATASKEKKYSDTVDMDLLKDVPAWLRSLRLHKYNPIFEATKWQDMVKMDDDALTAKGVLALGARRKMLKVFDQVKQHCKKHDIPY